MHVGSVAMMAGQQRLADFILSPLQCIASRSLGGGDGEQLLAIVARHVKAHPETSAQDVSRVIRNAIVEVCEGEKR